MLVGDMIEVTMPNKLDEIPTLSYRELVHLMRTCPLSRFFGRTKCVFSKRLLSKKAAREIVTELTKRWNELGYLEVIKERARSEESESNSSIRLKERDDEAQGFEGTSEIMKAPGQLAVEQP